MAPLFALSLLASLFGLGGVTAAPAESIAKRSPTIGEFNFTQRTNHFPGDRRYGPAPEKATFQMQYIMNDTFYKPGGPVICLLGGETSAKSRSAYMKTGIVQKLTQATGGMGVILEHRYYGNSFPTGDLSTDSLRWLDTAQSIADIAYFAQHVKFPGHENQNLTAPHKPWILYGGSLAGAEASFTLKTYGDIIYGAIGASAVTKARLGYPEWYYNVAKYAPQECVKRIQDNVDRIDHVVGLKDKKALAKLQDIFGLGALQDVRDFALTIAFPIGNPFFYPTNTWQELNWDPNYGSNDFYNFCSNVTSSKSSKNASSADWALSKYTDGEQWTGLGGWADYVKKVVLPLCPPGDSLDSNDCFGTHNATWWANSALPDPSGLRAYLWQSCTELGQYTQAAPKGRQSLISRTLQTDHTQQWCKWAFPDGKYAKLPSSPDTSRWNKYGGFEIAADRLALVDGGEDVWLYGCVHSPEGPKRDNTLLRPSYVIKRGGHHWDENGLTNIADEPSDIQTIHNYEIKFVKHWLSSFEKWRSSHQH